uniref:Uncharacterized protein n=1 Tax=Rhizophora mucronata TaxID=61149 RepID=A0A2P2QL47_RHIMU
MLQIIQNPNDTVRRDKPETNLVTGSDFQSDFLLTKLGELGRFDCKPINLAGAVLFKLCEDKFNILWECRLQYCT